MSDEETRIEIFSFADVERKPEKDPPFWLAMLRIYKELNWRTERGSKERKFFEDRMERARDRWLGRGR
jgi:hypothetical protein